MALGDGAATDAQVMLNTAVRRLLLWKDWWRDNGQKLLEAAPDNTPYELGEHHRAVQSALWRLEGVRKHADSAVQELKTFEQQHPYGYSSMPGYEECEEVEDLTESLASLEKRLQHEEQAVKELEEAAQRLLNDQKEEKEKKTE